MRKILTTIVIVAFSNSLFSQWITRDSMPTKRQEMPAVFLNGKIYVIGGIAANAVTLALTERYDPTTNKWDTIASLPVTRNHHCATVVNGKIYVLGGYDNVLFKPHNNVYEYNPINNSWLEKDTIPQKLSAADAVTYNGKIYLFGGTNSSNVLNTTYVYDVVSGSWIQKASFTIPREHLAASVIGNKIYVVSGRGTLDAETTLEVYDPLLDSWQTKASMPTARSGIDAVTIKDRLIVLGGEGNGVYNQNEEYDPPSDTWQILTPLPNARHGLTTTAVGDTIYAIGGGIKENLGASNINEAYIVPTFTSLFREEEVALNLYYNQFQNTLIVKNKVLQNSLETITVTDILGKEVFHNSLLLDGKEYWKNELPFLETGTYFAFLQTAKGFFKLKFLVLK